MYSVSPQGRSPRGDLPQEPGRACHSPARTLSLRTQYLFLKGTSVDSKMYPFRITSEPFWVQHSWRRGGPRRKGPTHKAGRERRESLQDRSTSAPPLQTPCWFGAHTGQVQAMLPRSAVARGGPMDSQSPPEATPHPPATVRCSGATRGTCKTWEAGEAICGPGSRGPDRDLPPPTPAKYAHTLLEHAQF